MTGWAMFWLCVAVWIVAEVVITLHGVDTALWQFRTPAELEIQRKLAGLGKPLASPQVQTQEKGGEER